MRAVAIGSLAILVGHAVLCVIGRVLMARREPEVAPSPPSEPDVSQIATRSGRVNVLDRGAGDVVILVHGSGRSIGDWQEGFAAALAQSFRVIAFDNYGFGRSERNHPWSYGIALWARQSIDLLDALHIERAVILGHSSGGAVAAIVAADHPERIRGAILVGHGMAADPAQLVPAIPGIGELWASRLDANGEIFSETHRAQLASSYRVRGTHAALLTFIRRQFTIDGVRLLRGTYEDIRVPVLQIHGSNDTSIPIAAAQALSPRIRNSRFVAIAGAGHNVHFDRPLEMAATIAAFVKQLGP